MSKHEANNKSARKGGSPNKKHPVNTMVRDTRGLLERVPHCGERGVVSGTNLSLLSGTGGEYCALR